MPETTDPQPDRRGRIADAIREWHGDWSKATFAEAADAVLAVLPPPADRAAILREAADFLRDAHFRDGLSVQEIGTAMRHWADREQPSSTAPLAAGMPLVKGNCPACQRASLFLGSGGYVTCSNTDCPEPDAATTVLEQPAAEAHEQQSEAEAVSPTAALLASRCDACRHTLNRHQNYGGCTVALCVCGSFQPPAEEA